MGHGGKREGAGRKPGPGKWSKDARELRDRLLETGKSSGGAAGRQHAGRTGRGGQAGRAAGRINLTALNADDAKTFLDLLGKSDALKAAANQCAKDVAPYLQPKVTQKDEALEIDLPKMETLADLGAGARSHHESGGDRRDIDRPGRQAGGHH